MAETWLSDQHINHDGSKSNLIYALLVIGNHESYAILRSSWSYRSDAYSDAFGRRPHSIRPLMRIVFGRRPHNIRPLMRTAFGRRPHGNRPQVDTSEPSIKICMKLSRNNRMMLGTVSDDSPRRGTRSPEGAVDDREATGCALPS
jgi:hypothetical protein